MTSSTGNIFHVTGLLCGEFTGDRWIPLTNATDAELWGFLWSAPEWTVAQTIARLVIWDAIAARSWSRCNDLIGYSVNNATCVVIAWWRHDMEARVILLVFFVGNPHRLIPLRCPVVLLTTARILFYYSELTLSQRISADSNTAFNEICAHIG